jgi:hypothetical protein
LLTLASAAVESTLASTPTTPNIVTLILIMTISLGRVLALRHGTDDERCAAHARGQAVMSVTLIRFLC